MVIFLMYIAAYSLLDRNIFRILSKTNFNFLMHDLKTFFLINRNAIPNKCHCSLNKGVLYKF